MAIIGISGKKQHGKDTVCKIIQYLIANKKQGYNLTPDMLDTPYHTAIAMDSGWQRKLFADKLKDIVCMLINCTREQLEDNTFKEKKLGEEWNIWMPYSTRLQKYIGKMYNTISECQEGIKNYHTIMVEDNVLPYLRKMTPRLLLQLLGTECGRQIIHPNIWINALMSEYKPTNDCQQHSDGENEITPIYPNWIITDVRFPNEAQAIKDRGGLLFRVIRFNGKMIHPTVIQDTHESETALDKYKGWDAIIVNDSSIEELIKVVEMYLKKYNLL